MKQHISDWQWWLTRLICILLATLVCTCVLGAILTQAATTSSPAWANPSVKIMRRVGAIPTTQSRPTHFYNLDCSPMTYRVPASTTMQTGCFTETAFGWLDSDSQVAIFRGTDEGLPLLSHMSDQILTPWPDALNLISLSVQNPGTASLAVYKNPLKHLQDKRNLAGKLTAKQMTAKPDLVIRDKADKPLAINVQTLAFSDGGVWLAAETVTGAFVRINVATLEIVAFAPALSSQGSTLHKSHIAISEHGRYIAVANHVIGTFRVYDLTTCGPPVGNLLPQNCQSFEYRPFVQQQIGTPQIVGSLHFVRDNLLGFEAVGTQEDGAYLLAPTATIDSSLEYLGLGDSFTSGDGAFNYLVGTDTSTNTCHVSGHSYPLAIAREVFTQQRGRSAACSGARIHDITATNDSYTGQVRGGIPYGDLKNTPSLEAILTNFTPGSIAQHRFAQHYQPKVLTVSVGGNDIGFGSILKQCTVPHFSRHLSDNTCYNTYEDRLEVTQLIDKTVPRWTNLFKQLKSTSPQSRIYAIGYPQLADGAGNCALNVKLNKSELEFTSSLISYLNSSIKKAATKADVTFVDVSNALVGHRLCEAASYAVAVNGLTAGKDSGLFGIEVFGRESYHPNAFGQELLKESILTQTKNFTQPPAAASPPDTTSNLLDKPKTGRAVVDYVPTTIVQSDVIKPGRSYELALTGIDHALRPSTSYKVYIDGAQGALLGSVVTSETGTLTTTVAAPSNLSPGGHTIDVVGENQAGEPVRITQPVVTPVSEQDSDGDTTPDTHDSCPYIPSSNQDDDHDGIDDACDGSMGSNQPSQPQPSVIGMRLGSSKPYIVAHLRSSTHTQTTSFQAGRILGVSHKRPGIKLQPTPRAGTIQKSLPAQPKPSMRLVPWLGFLLAAWLLIFIFMRRRDRNKTAQSSKT